MKSCLNHLMLKYNNDAYGPTQTWIPKIADHKEGSDFLSVCESVQCKAKRLSLTLHMAYSLQVISHHCGFFLVLFFS